jgi:hypothetical protein
MVFSIEAFSNNSQIPVAPDWTAKKYDAKYTPRGGTQDEYNEGITGVCHQSNERKEAEVL